MHKNIKDEFEYKGWFFACPVYLNLEDDEQGVECAARLECLEWWFSVNAWICAGMIGIISLLNPNYEPSFPFMITGKIRDEKTSCQK